MVKVLSESYFGEWPIVLKGLHLMVCYLMIGFFETRMESVCFGTVLELIFIKQPELRGRGRSSHSFNTNPSGTSNHPLFYY